MAEPLRESQAFFGDKVEAYRTSATHGNADDLARMISLLGPRRGRALDVATGGGHTARALERAGFGVVATDATLAMLGDFEGGAPVAADALALPFASARFDVVACRIAAHHFASLPRFVAEAARVLAPGGALYAFDLTTPEETGSEAWDAIERARDPSHRHSFSKREWIEACKGAGLSVTYAETFYQDLPLEPWIARAGLTPAEEARLRKTLDEAASRGIPVLFEGKRRVARVEIVARK